MSCMVVLIDIWCASRDLIVSAVWSWSHRVSDLIVIGGNKTHTIYRHSLAPGSSGAISWPTDRSTDLTDQLTGRTTKTDWPTDRPTITIWANGNTCTESSYHVSLHQIDVVLFEEEMKIIYHFYLILQDMISINTLLLLSEVIYIYIYIYIYIGRGREGDR